MISRRPTEVHPARRSVDSVWRSAARSLSPSASANLDAQLLLGHVLDRNRSWVLSHPEASVPAHVEESFQKLVARRAKGEPLAYIRGHVSWRDLELAVNGAVLVPRPETELMVELAQQCAETPRSIVDVGTGSGAIAIALARLFPSAAVHAIDNDVSALKVAAANARSYELAARVRLLRGHLLEPLSITPDLIVANLPYLSDAMMESIGRDVRHEPVAALHGGTTGLELYAELFQQIGVRGGACRVLCEIDPRQADAIKDLAHSALPRADVEIHPDYSGRARVAALLVSALVPTR